MIGLSILRFTIHEQMDWNNPLIHSVLVIVAITIAFLTIMLLVAFTVLAERRVLAFIQGRVGPNRVGYGGVLQPFADFIKTMIKEDLVPDQSTRFVFLLAPMIAVITAIMAIVVYPFGPTITLPFTNWSFPLVIARFDVALLYVLGVTSVGVYGIALAGWSSNNKYSLMGGLRSAAQMISYELALGLVAGRCDSDLRHPGHLQHRRAAVRLVRHALEHHLSAAWVSFFI